MASKEKFITPKKRVKAFKKPDIILDAPKKTSSNKKLAAAALGGAALGTVIGGLAGTANAKKCSPQAQRYLDEIESVITTSFNEKNTIVDDMKTEIASNNKKLLEEKTKNEQLKQELALVKSELAGCKRELNRAEAELFKVTTMLSVLKPEQSRKNQ